MFVVYGTDKLGTQTKNVHIIFFRTKIIFDKLIHSEKFLLIEKLKQDIKKYLLFLSFALASLTGAQTTSAVLPE